jgi:hypothetical protein
MLKKKDVLVTRKKRTKGVTMRIFPCAVRLLVVIACIGALAGMGRAEPRDDTGAVGDAADIAVPTFAVDGTVALASLIAISDGHLAKIADQFKILATRQEVIRGDWKKIKPLLAQVADRNVPALLWFAHPTGEYRTVQHDGVNVNLRSRPYFHRLLAGKTVIGDLVVSKSTGKNIAVVAIPVFQQGKVVGVLGASIYLDKLSERIKQEMALPPNMIFYSFDSRPLLALVWDQGLIFTEPKSLGEEVDKAFHDMVKREEGSITYRFRGKVRHVLFKKSPVTNWTYAIGLVEGETGSGRAR